MGRVPRIEIVRRAYKIWEDAGKPEGKDEEFYHRAERELEKSYLSARRIRPIVFRNLWSSFAIPFPLQRPNYRPSQ